MNNKGPKSGIITLTTDFGDTDSYAGIMKGVILGIAPDTRIVDITHHISSHYIESASYLLWTYYNKFPPGTVHCVVVDPDVGSARAPLAVRFEERFFVLPDNGLLGMTLNGDGKEFEARRIENSSFMLSPVSNTFHGRDVFAPAAAALASGRPFDSIGPLMKNIVQQPLSVPRVSGNTVKGKIVHVDKFGNYITNIPGEIVSGFDGTAIFVRIGGFNIIGMSRTYSDRKAGELSVYVGSTGLIEICTVKGSALETVGLPVGSEVMVKGRTT